MRIGITGSHGLIGAAVVARLERDGHEVRRVARTRDGEPRVEGAAWFSPKLRQACLGGLESFDGLVHLAGEPIGEHRWTSRIKGEIYASRVFGTEAIVRGIKELTHPPRVFLSASAIGFYGDQGEASVREDCPCGQGFLAQVVKDWEASAQVASDVAETVTYLRTGLVLSRTGGLLKRLLGLYQLGLGGPLGSGSQFMSAISLEDEVSAIMSLLVDPLAGPVNLVGPTPVRNVDWSRSLAKYLGRPHFMRVPTPLLELVLGKEMAEETALISQRVEPGVLQDRDFRFRGDTLDKLWEVVLG